MKGLSGFRRGAVIAVAAAAILGASGCTTTSYSCSNSTCEVSMSGSGATTELGSDGSPITLVSVADGIATIQVADEKGTCAEGETIELADLTVECTKVDGDSVELIVNG